DRRALVGAVAAEAEGRDLRKRTLLRDLGPHLRVRERDLRRSRRVRTRTRDRPFVLVVDAFHVHLEVRLLVLEELLDDSLVTERQRIGGCVGRPGDDEREQSSGCEKDRATHDRYLLSGTRTFGEAASRRAARRGFPDPGRDPAPKGVSVEGRRAGCLRRKD